MHAARPAQVAEGKYCDQHYFGADIQNNTHNCLQLKYPYNKASVAVLRFADLSTAQLNIATGSGFGAHTDLSLHMDADQMQTLACALLDAAHELRTVPAISKEEVAA
jgi:hypothetical protein